MGDDWEDDEWDAGADNFAAKAGGASGAAANASTKGAGANEPDMSKFADEEEEEENDEPVHKVVEPQPKKKEEKKYLKGESSVDDQPLDDPVEEKARLQRLIEKADLEAAKDLFAGASGVILDVFLPKSVKDFEEYAQTIVAKFAHCHKDSKNYKAFIKSLMKHVCASLPSGEVKEIETTIAIVRQDKMKAEMAEVAEKTKKTKKSLNMGKGKSAGLDDYIYDDSQDHDDGDFM
eukprot:gene3900-13970_t